MNDQQKFWNESFGDVYRKNNSSFDDALQNKAWNSMFKNLDTQSIDSILECGCNIGRNLITLQKMYPDKKYSLIELNKDSYKIAVDNIKPIFSFNGPINESNFIKNSFDLTFTCGVLIHIAPYDLYKNIEKLYIYSKKYILLAEYFSRQMEPLIYHGEKNKLFKMDFGGFLLDNYNVEIVDYGFLWGREYDKAGFDDITWWLFKKN